MLLFIDIVFIYNLHKYLSAVLCTELPAQLTCWLTMWPMKRTLEVHRVLSFLLKPRLKLRMSLLSSSSPMFGNLVLMIAARAAYTWVNVGEAVWA